MTSMFATKSARIEEFLVAADVTRLNEDLAARGIDPDAVISILPVAGTRLAGGPGDRFRALYRAG